MRSNSGSGKANDHAPGHENVGGIAGKEAHGGDVAPPNSDEAGERLSPESGPIDKH